MRKNKKRIDPRYFLNETTHRDLDENEQLEDKDKFMLKTIDVPMIVSPRFSAINMKEWLDEQWDAYGSESELQKWVDILSDPDYRTLVAKENKPNFDGTASGFHSYTGMAGIKEGIEAWIRSKVG